MRNKIIINNLIAILSEINIVLQIIFITEKNLNVAQALWWLSSLLLLNIYVFLSIKLVFYGNKKECLIVDNKTTWFNNICLILVLLIFCFATLTISLESINAKFYLYIVIALLLTIENILRIIYSRKVLSLKVIDKDSFDFSNITNERIKCTEQDVVESSFCFVVMFVTSFLLFVPMIAMGFENLNILLIVSIASSILCNVVLLLSSLYLYNKITQLSKNLIISYFLVSLNQVCSIVLSCLIYYGANDILRGGVFLFIIASYVEVYLIIIGPMAKRISAMKAYLNEL